MQRRVAHVVYAFNSGSGGPPRSISLIAQAAGADWDTELFTTDSVGPSPDSLLTQHFPGDIHLVPAHKHRALGDVLLACGAVRSTQTRWRMNGRPALLHLHGAWDLFLLAFASMANHLDIPYILAPRGMLEPWSLSVHSWRKSLALKTYQGKIIERAAAIHATSSVEAANLRRLPCVRAPIFVVPNPVEEPRRAPIQRSVASPERKILLFLSRVHPKKGLDILLEAWNIVRPSDWSLWIVGGGEREYVDRLKRYCAREKVPDVEFHAHVDTERRESMFERASALVLPTYSENFGNVVAEALIRGLPVITTTGTPWSAIGDQKLGWYIEPTAEQLRRALIELLGTPAQELQDMGERGLQYARETLSVAAVRHSLFDMYDRVTHPAGTTVERACAKSV